MPSDFLELLNAAVSYGDDTETIDERIRCALFECLFQGMHDNRVASLFRMIGWSNGFDCYAIAGSPAQSAARTRADIERVVSDFAGSCLTAETVLRNYGRSMDGGRRADPSFGGGKRRSHRQHGRSVFRRRPSTGAWTAICERAGCRSHHQHRTVLFEGRTRACCCGAAHTQTVAVYGCTSRTCIDR